MIDRKCRANSLGPGVEPQDSLSGIGPTGRKGTGLCQNSVSVTLWQADIVVSDFIVKGLYELQVIEKIRLNSLMHVFCCVELSNHLSVLINKLFQYSVYIKYDTHIKYDQMNF